MPIPKSVLGIHGEHLVADSEGSIPVEGDKPEDLKWEDNVYPGHSSMGPPTSEMMENHPDGYVRLKKEFDTGTPYIHYDTWDEYYRACLTAQTRHENVKKMDAEDAARPPAQATGARKSDGTHEYVD
jgi:hypothetical protein